MAQLSLTLQLRVRPPRLLLSTGRDFWSGRLRLLKRNLILTTHQGKVVEAALSFGLDQLLLNDMMGSRGRLVELLVHEV